MSGLDRRTLLGSVGAGALASVAGCVDLLGSDDSPRRFEGDELGAILSTDAPDVVRPVPVQPSEDATTASVDRLEGLIESVPDPLEPDDVPNEAVRRRVDRQREIAEYRRDALERSPDRFRRYVSSVRARRYAGQATGSLAAVDGDLSRSDVVEDRDEVLGELETRLAGIDHVGDDRDRTLVLEHRLERELGTAKRFLENRPRDRYGNEALDLGDAAGTIERARGVVSFVEAVQRRHDERLEDGRSFASTFDTALDRSLEAVESVDVVDRWNEPSAMTDADVSGTPAERLLVEAGRTTSSTASRTTARADGGQTASALRYAAAFERDRRALKAIRERIEDGAHREIDSVDDVRDVREAALEAAADAPFDPDDPTLGGDLLADAYGRIENADDLVREYLEEGRSYDLFRQYADYATIGAQLDALPDAIATLEERFD